MSCSSKDNTWSQHQYQQLSMRKKNTKLKKYRSTGNEAEECNIWYIGKVMGMNIINGLQKQVCLIQKRQLKTIGQGV